MFYWFGVFMGGMFCSDESFILVFLFFVWKLIVGEYVMWVKDYVVIDEVVV